MAKKTNPAIIGLGLYKASGGPVKTMSKFREAMDASINCFVNPQQYKREPVDIDE